MKIKKVCKCGRIFYDTEDNKKCPCCRMKKNVKVGTIGIGVLAIGATAKKHSKAIKKVAKTVGDVVLKIAKK